MNTLIEAIKEARDKRELNDAQLAKLLNISPAQWSRLQSGQRQFGHKSFGKILLNLPEVTIEVVTYQKKLAYLAKNGE